MLQNSHWFCESPLGRYLRDLSWQCGREGKRGEERREPTSPGGRGRTMNGSGSWKEEASGERGGRRGGFWSDYEDNNSALEPPRAAPFLCGHEMEARARSRPRSSKCLISSFITARVQTAPKINVDHYVHGTCKDTHTPTHSQRLVCTNLNTQTVFSGTLRPSYDPSKNKSMKAVTQMEKSWQAKKSGRRDRSW